MTVQRAGRIVAAIGFIVWAASAIWITFLPLTLGWKLLWVAFALAGALNWGLILIDRPTLFERIGRVFKSMRRSRD